MLCHLTEAEGLLSRTCLDYSRPYLASKSAYGHTKALTIYEYHDEGDKISCQRTLLSKKSCKAEVRSY